MLERVKVGEGGDAQDDQTAAAEPTLTTTIRTKWRGVANIPSGTPSAMDVTTA